MSTSILPYNTPQSFIVYWPGEPYKLQWDGDGVGLPGGRATVEDKHLFRFISARDETGRFVPGTLVLTRIMGFDEKKGEPFVAFEPKDWLEGVFGKDGISGPCTNMAKRGLRIVNRVEELSDQLRGECQDQWEAAQEQSDLEAIAQELGRRARYERDGRQAPPLPPKSENYLLEISQRLGERNTRKKRSVVSSDALKAVLSGGALPASAVDAAPAEPAISIELQERIKALLATAKEFGVDVSIGEQARVEKGDHMAIEELLARIKQAPPPAPVATP